MKIENGEPTKCGRYALYIDVDLVPTVIRVCLPGKAWISNKKEPIIGKVVSWIGPLPVKGDVPEYEIWEEDFLLAPQEFDL